MFAPPLTKIAMVHDSARAKYKTDLEKAAYDNGAAMASQTADAGMPDAAPGAAPAESDDVSDEDIIAVLQQLIQSGQITQDVAAEIVQQLGMGGGAGGAGGAGDAGGSGAGGPPPGAGADAGAGAGGPPPGAGGSPDDQTPEKAAAEVLSKTASVVDGIFKQLTQKAA
jgi:hypothetical protein